MGYISSFKKFTESMQHNRNYNFGCVLLKLEFKDNFWNELLAQIDDNDLYHPEEDRYGKELESHVTLLYGLEPSVSDKEVLDVCRKFNGSDVIISCSKIECFQNKDFDVVKLTMDSPILHTINKELRNLDHIDSYPDYKPHATIAFLKPGMGSKYCHTIEPIIIKGISNLIYSKTSGDEIIINV